VWLANFPKGQGKILSLMGGQFSKSSQLEYHDQGWPNVTPKSTGLDALQAQCRDFSWKCHFSIEAPWISHLVHSLRRAYTTGDAVIPRPRTAFGGRQATTRTRGLVSPIQFRDTTTSFHGIFFPPPCVLMRFHLPMCFPPDTLGLT
jgi:hypothetical protein